MGEKCMMTVSEAARRLGVIPRVLSDLFYRRMLPDADARCPIVRRYRMIPLDYLPVIERALSEHRPTRQNVLQGAA